MKDFSRLVIIAFLISAPLAWWLLNMYLERYRVRRDIQVWIFPVTGIFAWLLTLIIVLNQTIGTALMNPVESLRND
jgi:hypothetical protein